MGNTEKASVTQDQVDHAKHLWVGFTKFLKYGTIATIASLILLALITL